MKKIIFSLFVFFIFPLFTLAVDYDIEQYYIDAKVLENGDMEVSELILLDGTFNGYERDILYKNDYTNSNLNATGISDIKIYGKQIDKISFSTFDEPFNEFVQVSSANNGDIEKYIVSSLNGGYRYRMYYKTNNSKTAFLIKYTLEDIVIMHSSFAELYWNFIGNDFADNINDLQIKVTLPGKDNSNNFYHWVHGDVSGESKRDDNNTNSIIIAKVPINKAYEPVDIRITFDKSLVNSSEIKKYSDESLNEILEYEQKLYEENENLRKDIKRKWNTALYGTIGFYILTIGLFIFIYLKYDKERRPMFLMKYNREFIDDYNVEVIDYLMNHRITENALSASIMNLIYKKNIKVEKIEGTKNDYKFTLMSKNKLNETELALTDFLFTTVGTNNIFTTASLKKYASSTKTCQTFMNTYTNWQKKVIADGEKEEFFEKKKTFIWLGFIPLIYSIILLTYISSNNIEMFFGILTIVFGIIFLIYVVGFTKKTRKGIEHYARWKAFKNFLKDFGNFSVKELPEIILWERYLVYATIFGLADKVEKNMNVKINEIEGINIDAYTLNYITNYHIANLITSSMHSAITTSQTTINRINASTSSGSNGFGGGFSGGGGFGGGGGGGRGF